MDKIRRRAGLALTLVSLVGLGLAGCGDNPDATGEAGIGPPGEPAPNAVGASEDVGEAPVEPTP